MQRESGLTLLIWSFLSAILFTLPWWGVLPNDQQIELSQDCPICKAEFGEFESNSEWKSFSKIFKKRRIKDDRNATCSKMIHELNKNKSLHNEKFINSKTKDKFKHSFGFYKNEYCSNVNFLSFLFNDKKSMKQKISNRRTLKSKEKQYELYLKSEISIENMGDILNEMRLERINVTQTKVEIMEMTFTNRTNRSYINPAPLPSSFYPKVYMASRQEENKTIKNTNSEASEGQKYVRLLGNGTAGLAGILETLGTKLPKIIDKRKSAFIDLHRNRSKSMHEKIATKPLDESKLAPIQLALDEVNKKTPDSPPWLLLGQVTEPIERRGIHVFF